MWTDPFIEACADGDIDTVHQLVKQGYNPNADTDGLHKACRHGHFELVQVLIEEYGCNPRGRDYLGNTLLHVACREGRTQKFVRYLTKQKQCDQTIVNHAGELPLHIACAWGNLDIVKLVADCDVNTCTKEGDTPLHVACRMGATEIVRYLTEQKGCDQTIVNHAGELPLHIACRRGNLDIVKLVAECDVNTCTMEGNTPLHVACRGGDTLFYLFRRWGNTKIVRYLTEQKGCDQTIVNHAGELPLHIACRGGNLDIVKLVAGPDVNTCTMEGDTPLHVACREGATEIVRYLTEQKGCDQTIVNHAGELPLHSACRGGNLDIVKLVADCDVNTRYSNTNMALSVEKGDTPLHVACRMGATEIVRYLTKQKGCDQTIVNHAGELPLHSACRGGNLDIVILLAGRDVNTCTMEGDTPLHVACREGATEIVRYLTEQKGCDQTIVNHAGELPLHSACRGGNLDIVKLVADCDVNTCYRNMALSIEKGDTPLHVACRMGATEIVRYLTEQKGCDQTIVNHAGELPLHIACARGDLDIVKLVADCDVNTCTNKALSFEEGDTPLHVACRKGATKIVRYLTEQKKCDQTIVNHAGELPLHIACARENVDIVKLVADCDVNTCTMEGDTPLHVACREGATDTIVRFLVTVKQCKVRLLNRRGELPQGVTWSKWLVDFRKQEILEQVRRSKGTIPVRIVKLLFNGSPRVGKSSLMRKLAGILREESPSTGVANAPLKVTIKRISQSVAQVSGLNWSQLGLDKEVATLLTPLLVQTTSIARKSELLHGGESSDGHHSTVLNLTDDIQAHPTDGFLHDTSEEEMLEAATDPLQDTAALLTPDDFSMSLHCRTSLPDNGCFLPMPVHNVEVPFEGVASASLPLPTTPQPEIQSPPDWCENFVSECTSNLSITHLAGSHIQLSVSANIHEGTSDMSKQDTPLDCKTSTPDSLNLIEDQTLPDQTQISHQIPHPCPHPHLIMQLHQWSCQKQKMNLNLVWMVQSI